jgi:DNA-binding transcriptional LysR family regulator
VRQLRYFVAVAEEQHFGRAAARLHVSQPPLTQRIQDLERDLGVELFSRADRRIALTEAGRFVLTEARATLAQAERVREVARRAAQGEAGSLRIAVVASALFVPTFTAAVEAFRRDHPHIAFDLAQMTSRGALDAFEQRKVDLCVIRRGEPGSDGVPHTILARDRLMLVLPASHAKILAEKVALDELDKERFIALSDERSVALYRQIMHLWARSGLTPRIVQRAENALVILALVAADRGNAILPSVLRETQVSNVVWKDIAMDERWTASSIVMMYRTDAPGATTMARFVTYVEHHGP